jgi:hypothetical protein
MGKRFPTFEKIDALAKNITAREDRLYDLSVLRQTLSLALLRDTIPECFVDGQFVLIIGDGFGTLTSLFLTAEPAVRVLAVNLTPSLLLDLSYVRHALPDIRLGLATDANEIAVHHADSNVRLIAIQADNVDLLANLPISLAVNIASMQEMNPSDIEGYFSFIRTSTAEKVAFYCCNRENKELPDGTVIRFDDYPWLQKDRIVFDELCPWHSFYYAFTPPFYRPYVGPIRHRLAFLNQIPGGHA